ncbi:MAG TPA: 6-phosphogluconolactonase [Thermoanaerobaculia bacterium]|nr:6-phosphogluconolactonase [Thermoanaerobaculia bacterium]
MNLRIFDSPEELIRATARTILQQLHPGLPATIAISGGSTPKPLYELLATEPWREQLARTPVTWVLVDERYVPRDDPQSNAAMIERTLFANGVLPSHRFVSFDTTLEDPHESAGRYASALPEDPFDIILLGIGDDGHTASLFPDTGAIDIEDCRAAAIYVPKLEQWRVTLTKPVLRAATLRLVLVTGASKAPVVAAVREGADLPISVVTRGVETWWLVSRDVSP